MSRRCYWPGPWNQSRVQLAGAEAHHLADVLRSQPGDVVILFDGTGQQAQARVESITKRGIDLQILEVEVIPADPGPSLVLATAVPKGDRCDWLVEKATELGVSQWIPLLLERSVVKPGSGKLEKLRLAVIAACKQSGRAHALRISDPQLWGDFLRERPADSTLTLCDPTGERHHTSPSEPVSARYFAIGPEGGFTAEEIQLGKEAGGIVRSLGRNILRIETAALAVAARETVLREFS